MRLFIPLFTLILLVSCNSDSSDPLNGDPAQNGDSEQNSSYQLVDAFPELPDFNRPVDLQHAGDESNLLFVVEQRGVITVFDNDPEASESSTFLDIENRVNDSGNEEGLLGLAFHPDFANNGFFYVNYTSSETGGTVISRFDVSADDPQQAIAGSETIILTFDQPYPNHNGGQVSFGPDGYLYIAVGDGGAANDPESNGQDRTTLLGTILRIDVDSQENGNNYGIPEDNPFAGNDEGYREEIYAWGLRNPWRFSFDSETGDLWTGDVGQGTLEEIDIIENGGNYGWNTMEGTRCFRPSDGCDTSGLEMPVYEYDHSVGLSITGGFVYRGPTMESLTGRYIYTDFVTMGVWAFDNSVDADPVNEELLEAGAAISSFGVDQNQELYMCAFDGRIYKFITD